MNEKNKEISLRDLLDLFLPKIWILVIAAIIGGSAMFAYSRVVLKPKYKASASVCVYNGSETATATTSNISIARARVPIYMEMVKMNSFLALVKQQIDTNKIYIDNAEEKARDVDAIAKEVEARIAKQSTESLNLYLDYFYKGEAAKFEWAKDIEDEYLVREDAAKKSQKVEELSDFHQKKLRSDVASDVINLKVKENYKVIEKEVIQSFTDKVRKPVEYSESAKALSPRMIGEMVDTTQYDETEMFMISVTSDDPKVALDLINAISICMESNEMKSNVPAAASVKVVNSAEGDDNLVTIGRGTVKNAVIGALVALFLAMGAIFLVWLFDVRIYDKKKIEDYFDIPILGVIPAISVESLSDVNAPSVATEKKGE